VARAQQRDRMRTLGVLSGSAESDPNNRNWFSAFDTGLHSLGWTEGQNIQIERRYAPGDINRMQTYAKELVDLKPDLIFVTNTPSAIALSQNTHTIPVLFVNVTDPIGSGLVSSLANPGGNVSGFTNFEFTMGGKWLQILKQVAPDIKRAAIIFNPELAPCSGGYVRSFEIAASSFGVEPIVAPVLDIDQLDRVLVAQAREPGGSIVVVPDTFTVPNRERIIRTSVHYRLPAVYPYPVFAFDGGLIAYGPDIADLYRRAAFYADRILKGTNPGDLPIQQPTKFELVINLKTAKALGLTIPETLLATADEVIQ
jgi:putative tryptophan/tyrosine transport system substrate-binding protein